MGTYDRQACAVKRRWVRARPRPNRQRSVSRARDDASERLKELEPMQRQAAVNRALGLGRVLLIGARIMRALDEHGLTRNQRALCL